MEYHRQTMSGADLSNVINLPLSLRDRKVDVIILPVDDNADEKSKRKLKLDFVKEVPSLPDSFFDPLPEEELQLWGL